MATYSSSNHLDLVLGLPLRNHTELEHLLHDLYDPASPSFRKYLTPSQFAERFGPTERDYQAVADFVASHGLKITGIHPNRTLLDVSGSAADVEKAFHVRMGVYQHPSEARKFYAPDADPSVDLPVPILSVQGLDNFELPHPMDLTTAFDSTNAPGSASGSGPFGYFLGRDFRAAYAPGVALNGKGQSIGLLELDGYFPFDIAEYEFLAKLPNVTLTNILLDGVNGVPGGNETEVALDIEMAISMAPGVSQVLVYEGTNPDDILNRMATDNSASQLSCSWGFIPPVDATRDQIYEQFAAQGQTMFQSSGNNGAYAGAPESPSDDPNLTVVGGTLLTTSGAGGPWLAESAWSGSGGGSSTSFPLPPWQQGLSAPANQGSPLFRNVPDVAAVAGVSIWLIALDGEQGPIGGTSAAAPLWAGFAAMANQQAATLGKPPIGFINPTLYEIGRSAFYPSAFHDVVTGNNTNAASPTNFFATPGYDLCSGWGTPGGSNLINALVTPPDPLQIFPATNLIALAEGGLLGWVQDLFLVDIGSNKVDWSAGTSAVWLDVEASSGTVFPSSPAALAVLLSTNNAVTNLSPGTYTATIWFTNLNDGIVQSRQLTLNIPITSSVPVIVSQPLSQTALPGASAVFSVKAAGDSPLSYQWLKNPNKLADGMNITGSTNATLILSDVYSAAAGTYSVIVSNALGFVTSIGAVLTVASVVSSGVTISNLYSFSGAADGANPNGLMQDTNGNFYGTTQSGGAYSSGTVFRMTPQGVVTTIYPFDDSTTGGSLPEAGLVQGLDGDLYGTTQNGGANGVGTIFKTTTNGNLTTVYSFDGGDGAFPDAPMIVGTDGNMYGTTSSGGTDGAGEVFRLAPDGSLLQIGSFNYTNGFNPNKLLQAPDGTFYGTSYGGGSNGDGVIFDLTTNGALNPLRSFAFFSGGYLPLAGLAQDAVGTFFGTTFEGGASGFGTVFALSPSGAVTTVYSFTGGNDGSHPSADLIQSSDGNFYGTTSQGGAYNAGTVFRFGSGGKIVTLATFDGYNGSNPLASLVQGADGNLYGATQNGGASGNGVIFSVNINYPSVQITGQPVGQSAFFGAKAVFSVAVAGNPPLSFQWSKSGKELADGGNLSGAKSRVLTVSNVSPSDSAIYSVTVSNASGSAATSDGAFLDIILSPPQLASPLASQTATVGGSAEFHVDAVGNLPLSYQWQSNHITLIDGANVSGATTSTLTLSGLTQRSDSTISVTVSNAIGSISAEASLIVYPASVSGTIISSLYWFNGGAGGATPNGLVLGSNGVLYGTTQTGGAYNAGTIFSITTNGEFQTLVSFDTTNGSNPQAALTQGADGNFYGTTQDGGTNGAGTAFMVATNGALTTLATFGGESGVNPYVALTQASNGNFYGAAQNSSKAGDGIIFELTTAGVLNVFYTFSGGQDGNEPIGALTEGQDGNLYGMTTAGGAHGYGGIFEATPSGALTNLYSFTGGTDGYNPYGALLPGADGSFYGVTRRNAIQNVQFDGTIFNFSNDGNLTTLYTLNPLYNLDGEYPFAGLVQGADGNLYGTTLYSDSTLDGTVFGITTTGSYMTLATFNGADDGEQPKAAMVQDANGNLYGTTTLGGPYGKGSIFLLAATSAPEITVQPSSQTVFAGTSVQFGVSVFGASPLFYQWQKNGSSLSGGGRLSGASSRILMISNSIANDAGTYSVTVSDSLGSVTSSAAVLTVLGAPPIIQSVTQQNGMLSFTWSTVPGVSYQVQSTTDPASFDWTNAGGAKAATTGSLSDSFTIESGSQQFYRVVLLP